MSAINKLHKLNDIYTLEVSNGQGTVQMSIENPPNTKRQDLKSVAIKKIDGKVGITEGMVRNPMLSTRILLEKGMTDYIKSIEIDGGELALVGDRDYRQLLGRDEFRYKLDGAWISLHVVKELEDGDPVFYLVVNADVVKT